MPCMRLSVYVIKLVITVNGHSYVESLTLLIVIDNNINLLALLSSFFVEKYRFKKKLKC